MNIILNYVMMKNAEHWQEIKNIAPAEIAGAFLLAKLLTLA